MVICVDCLESSSLIHPAWKFTALRKENKVHNHLVRSIGCHIFTQPADCTKGHESILDILLEHAGNANTL
jgi:hypothetical protein